VTTGEFNTWFRRHQALFPKLAEWFAALADAKAVLEAWRKAMEPCDLAHATEATSRMLRGVEPLVEFNDWATLPSVVIRHCQLLGSGRPAVTPASNYVHGSAIAALKRDMSIRPPQSDAEVSAEFEALVEAMEPADYVRTKEMILDAMDANRLGSVSAKRLIALARSKQQSVPAGNAGDAFEDF
jgi:hypothetical protein